jgi:hypothetical protein
MNEVIEKKMKVSLFVVGAGKAGSTTMFDCLNRHPQLQGANPKEPMFFSHHMEKGLDWYHSLFQKGDNIQYYFEASPQYTFIDELPDVSHRIKEYNPQAKIIYIVREPIARIKSHFAHWARTKPKLYKNINDALTNQELRFPLVERTKYFKQISTYIDLFGNENVKVVFLEDLKSSFMPTITDVFQFLGVDKFKINVIHSNKTKANSSSRAATEIRPDILLALTNELEDDICKLLDLSGKSKDFWRRS